MRRATSNDLPSGIRLPIHAEAAKTQKQRPQRGFGLWDYYNRSLQTAPVVTKALTCFFGAVIGDTLAQWFTGASYDVARNMRMSLYGLIVGGPSGHYWHKFLEANIMPKRPTSRAAIVLKLLVDQLVFAPISTIMLFIALESMKGTPEQIPIIIQEKLWSTMKANWVVWPLANFIAFRFLHQDMRILYANIIGILWCAYVSLVFYNQVPKVPLTQ
ncbi:g76 [Coccomyxa elongata]